uniref:Uncharacterized protein n=1 Tax=Amphimedon queenslandica TaxID=400682 RepID=A0A1X7TSJ0_AMPQE
MSLSLSLLSSFLSISLSFISISPSVFNNFSLADLPSQ